jgi:hypothetical protein
MYFITIKKKDLTNQKNKFRIQPTIPEKAKGQGPAWVVQVVGSYTGPLKSKPCGARKGD